MAMPARPVHFSGMPAAIKSAPLLGEHTEEVLVDWLDLDAAAVADCAATDRLIISGQTGAACAVLKRIEFHGRD